MTTPTTLPDPSKAHATCAWCRTDFPTITALLSHVDNGHLEPGHSDRHVMTGR
jgi:hypothetical protein